MILLSKECSMAATGSSPRSGRIGTPPPARLVLASQSPRRRQLLAAEGIDFTVVEPEFDDADLAQGGSGPAQWVSALAYLKARAAIDRARREGADLTGVTVLGADTMVVDGDLIIGKPRDAADAGRMIRGLRNRSHQVVTGVALVEADGGAWGREIFSDTATVHVGALTDGQIDAYVASGAWRGKAGGYNLEEVMREGWPVTFEGDPATVMGLPMRTLALRLAGFRRPV